MMVRCAVCRTVVIAGGDVPVKCRCGGLFHPCATPTNVHLGEPKRFKLTVEDRAFLRKHWMAPWDDQD